MLLHQLLFGHRQFVAQQKILQGIAMQDIVSVQNLVLPGLKIKTIITCPQAVEYFAAPIKPPQRFAGMFQIGRLQIADRFNEFELHQGIERV